MEVTESFRCMSKINSLMASEVYRVQPGSGFIVKDDLRVDGDRAGQPHPLAHAARELGRFAEGHLVLEAHQFQFLAANFHGLFAGHL